MGHDRTGWALNRVHGVAPQEVSCLCLAEQMFPVSLEDKDVLLVKLLNSGHLHRFAVLVCLCARLSECFVRCVFGSSDIEDFA